MIIKIKNLIKMSNSIRNNIYKKIKLPPCGFILQKDMYITNLLYENHKFPLTSLKQRLPFRRKKLINPSHSISVLRENGKISENSESKAVFYSLNNFKPKSLIKRKLKFPLIKIKTIPLTNLNLNEEINKKDVKIKNMEDDLNITSNKGRKIIFKFKKNSNISDYKKEKFPSIVNNNNNINYNKYDVLFKHRRRNQNDNSMDKTSLNHIVDDLNKDIKNIKQSEKNVKRSFIRDKFFSTQIYVENLIEANNGENNTSIINKT
jgi:hypothetical protein